MTGDTQTISSTRAAKALAALTTLHFFFFFLSLIAIPILAPGSRIPNPFGGDEALRSFFLHASAAIRVSDFFQLASALCLGVASALFSNTVLVSTRRKSSSWLIIGGGSGAAIMLALAALFSWAIASPGTGDLGPALHAFQFIPFLLGGPGWAGFFAVLLYGIAMGARDVLPAWLRRFGYFLSFVSAAATAVLLSIVFSPCLPIARFLGFIWLIAVSIYLNRRVASSSS